MFHVPTKLHPFLISRVFEILCGQTHTQTRTQTSRQTSDVTRRDTVRDAAGDATRIGQHTGTDGQ